MNRNEITGKADVLSLPIKPINKLKSNSFVRLPAHISLLSASVAILLWLRKWTRRLCYRPSSVFVLGIRIQVNVHLTLSREENDAAHLFAKYPRYHAITALPSAFINGNNYPLDLPGHYADLHWRYNMRWSFVSVTVEFLTWGERVDNSGRLRYWRIRRWCEGEREEMSGWVRKKRKRAEKETEKMGKREGVREGVSEWGSE